MQAALILLVAWLAGAAPAWSASAPVVVLTVDGAIGPATADYFHRGLAHASASGAQLVVVQMDTPGGLDLSMRAMIQDILASPLPVATYVAPAGARAASAGTYLLYASHVAAMAPATNLGAATPVHLGGQPPGPGKEEKGKPKEGETPDPANAMARKEIHDAAAYIRSLAQLRGRNVAWGEQAVREAVSLSADEAIKLKVADLLAADLPDLMKRLDGRKVTTVAGERTLETASARLEFRPPDWRTRFLSVITQPGLAYILVLLGIYAVLYELANPGLVLPGVAGAIAVLTALYAFQMLPVNYAGLGLILLGMAFMAAEAFVPAYGSLGIGGVVAFVIGSVILIDTDQPGWGVPLALVAGFAAGSLGFLLLVAGGAVKARRRPLVGGRAELVGRRGEILEDCGGEGWARVGGETWRVHCATPLAAGRRVRVAGMRDLVLEVVPEDEKQGD